jgi:hypothetical protein
LQKRSRRTLESWKSPLQARSAASVKAVLEATIQVFLKVGEDRPTTTRVADRAGVSVSEMDEAALESGDDGLGSVIHVEAHENNADVTFHSGFGDAEVAGNFAIRFPPDHEVEDLALASAELRVGKARGESPRDGRGQKAAAGVDAAQSADQRIVGHPFDDVAARAGFERLMNVLIPLVGGEDDELRIGMARDEGADDFHAAHSGKAKIDEGDVGEMLLEKGDRVFAITRLRNGDHVGRRLDNGGDADAHDGMIVDHQNANFAGVVAGSGRFVADFGGFGGHRFRFHSNPRDGW